MKEIKYRGEVYYYKSYGVESTYESFNYGDSYTLVYDNPTMRRRKYWFFGPFIEVVNTRYLFKLNIDIENPRHSAEDLIEAFDKALRVVYRKVEIDSGLFFGKQEYESESWTPVENKNPEEAAASVE